MGNVRPSYIKKAAERIMEEYAGVVTTDFELNKELLDEVADIYNNTLRNKIAGYLVVLKKNENRIMLPPKTGNKDDRKKKKEQHRKWV